jgi:hypothetical protein
MVIANSAGNTHEGTINMGALRAQLSVLQLR